MQTVEGRVPNVHDPQPIRWRMHIPVPRTRVFDVLDSAEGRAAFWAEHAAEQDGVITFEFVDGTRHAARVLERCAPDLWRIEYFGGVATFTLADDGRGGTDLTLVHDGVPSDEWSQVHAGWLNVLFPLKAWAAFGADLRNHDPKRTWALGYADQ